jgi:uncharacterized protein (DUF2236 family)
MTGTIDGGSGRAGPVPPLSDAVRGAESPVESPLTSPAESAVEAPRPDRSFAVVKDEDLTGHWGLFGPGTVTWRVHSDPLIGLATLRSLALRVLHPEGLSGVFATARRVDDPWDRLTWTLRHLGVTTFGSGAEVAVAGARMRAILTQVSGVTPTGDTYRGDDPELMLWLHCCQVTSFAEVTRRGGLPLSDAEHDTYVREQQRAAAVLGLEPDEVPGNRRELAQYFRAARPRLRMTAPGRAFIEAIISPGVPELMSLAQRNRPPWAPVAGLAFGSLPSWARRLYSSPPKTGPAALSHSATTVALHTLRDSLSGRVGQAGVGLA